MERTTVEITGMSCGHCVAGVRRALEQIEGVEVQEVRVGSATVAYDDSSVTPERIATTIEKQGYGARVQERQAQA